MNDWQWLAVFAVGTALIVGPLIGPIDFGTRLELHIAKIVIDRKARTSKREEYPKDTRIHWVIVGGESGPGARPCNIEWIRSIVRQCSSARVPCFVKQLGAHPVQSWNDPAIIPSTFPVVLKHPKGGDPAEWPEDLRVRQFPEVKP